MMLELRDVMLCRQGRPVLTGLDLSVSPGEGVLVRGANGSGKTTLLRAVCGWRPAHRGAILWRGRPMPAALARLRGELAYLGHEDGLHDELSARENLAWLAGMAGEAASATDIDAALAGMGVLESAGKPARLLSRGQRRRTALARFLLTRKPLWVLDEPLAALDAAAQQAWRHCVMRHLQSGGLVLMSCHTDSWPHHPALQSLSLPAPAACAR